MALVGLGILIAVSAGLVLSRGTDHGATFTVNVTLDEADSNPGDGICAGIITPNVCTLRAAIQEANAFPGADTITVPAGTFNLTTLHGGELLISGTDGLTIIGAGPASTTIDANFGDRVFRNITLFAPVAISGVTIQGGNLGKSADGGGIWTRGSLTLTDVVVQTNSAERGGGIYNAPGAGFPLFFPAGTLTLLDSFVDSNDASGPVGDGGGI